MYRLARNRPAQGLGVGSSGWAAMVKPDTVDPRYPVVDIIE